MVSLRGVMLIPDVNAKCGMSETANAQLPTRPIMVLCNILFVCPFFSMCGRLIEINNEMII